jgi:hypothetical protein
MDPTEELKRVLLSERCPICNQEYANVEEHISKDHAGDLDIGFVKWVMRIHKDLEKLKDIEKGRGASV